MRVHFRVEGFPPKKDGANSMWGKPREAERVRALRLNAANAFAGRPPLSRNVRIHVDAHVGPFNRGDIGDLDNFVTGICDGLQPADPRARIAIAFEEHIRPSIAVGIANDREVMEIVARKIIAREEPFYELTLEGDSP